MAVGRRRRAVTATIGLWGPLVCATGLIANAPAAEIANPVVFFDIPAQPLAGALKEFAAQSHFQLLYQYSIVENLRGNRLYGQLNTRAALEELLRNTGLEILYSSDNAATIRPATMPQTATQTSTNAVRSGDAVKPADIAGVDRPKRSLRARLRDVFTECNASSDAACPPVGAATDANSFAANVQLAEVVVTGSRVITNGNDSPTPVTVVGVQDLLTTKPATVFENLIELPQFSGSLGAAGTPSMTGPTSGYVQALNLRNLGVLRSLVLFDGRRVPPTTADGYVNVNLLPQMLIQRVEVVTGGASAVYGSDAVTGVVNFIVDRNFDGLKVNLQRGISSRNDDASYQVGIAAGTDLFAGRGRFIGSYERYYNAGIAHRMTSGREWLLPLWTLQGDGSAANPYHLQDNVRIVSSTFGGRIVCPVSGFTQAACPLANGALRPLVGQTFDDNGVLSPFQTGATTGLTQGTIQIGGDGAYQNWPSLKAGKKLDQLYTRFDYEFTDELRGYVSASGALDYAVSNPTNLRSFGQGFILGSCNAFLAQQYQAALGCTNSSDDNQRTFRLSKVFDSLNHPGNPGTHDDSYARSHFIIAGLEGTFGPNYRWDVAYTKSQASMNGRTYRIHENGNLFAALDAVIDPANGQVVCRVTLTHPNLYPGCTPLNPFGPTAGSAAAIDYAFGYVEHKTINKLDGLSGSIAGAPFNSWAGPVDVALSSELRRQTFEFTTNAPTSETLNCTGLRFGNCVSDAGATTAKFANNYAIRTPVEQRAVEGAVEFNAPLLKDKPVLNTAYLNAAARFTRYDNDPGSDPDLVGRSISAATWKTGITWDVLDSLTLRWTRSRDMRAPNLFDLYEAVSINANTRTTDYLLPGTPVFNAIAVRSGNPDLKPEVSHTTTLGLVWRPTPEFSMSLDGYDITIKDALASINGATQPVQQACYASGGRSPLCSLLERPLGYSDTSVANAIAKTYTQRINIAEQRTWGIDFEANWKTEILGRRFALRTLLTYQPHLIYSQPPLATNDQAGASTNDTYGLLPAPVWKATAFMHYNFSEALAIDVSQRYRSGLRWSADPAKFGIGGVAAVTYTNLSASYAIDNALGRFSIYFNVQNLFDKDPPPAGAPNQQIQPGLTSNGFTFGDDVVGRYYTLGVRLRL